MTNQIHNSKGQVALVVLVVSAVVLSLGLSMSHKSVTETKITTDEESLKKAFNTAESGLDYYLSTGQTVYNLDAGGTATITHDLITNTAGNVMDYNEPTLAKQNVLFWMVGHDSNDNIDYSKIYRGQVDICVEDAYVGALKVDYYYTDATTGTGNFYVKRKGVNVGGSMVTGYDAPVGGAGSCGSNRRTITSTDTTPAGFYPLLITVTPLAGAPRVVASLSGSGILPAQGESISSLGVVGDPNTGTRTTVRIVKKYEIPQFMFDGLVSSAGDIDAN